MDYNKEDVDEDIACSNSKFDELNKRHFREAADYSHACYKFVYFLYSSYIKSGW